MGTPDKIKHCVVDFILLTENRRFLGISRGNNHNFHLDIILDKFV